MDIGGFQIRSKGLLSVGIRYYYSEAEMSFRKARQLRRLALSILLCEHGYDDGVDVWRQRCPCLRGSGADVSLQSTIRDG